MRPHWARASAAFLFAAGLFFAAGTARAQLGTGGAGGATGLGALGADDFFIGVQGTQGVNLTDYDLLTYFNQANCECEKPTYVFAALSTTGSAKRSLITTGNVEVWVGVQCDQPTLRPTQCSQLGTALLTAFAAQGGVTFTSDAKFLSRSRVVTTTTADGGVVTGTTPGIGGDPCNLAEQLSTQTIFLLVDQDADQTFELSVPRSIPIDLTSPPIPTNVTTAGGNEAVVVNWTSVPSTVDSSGILGYQILCDRANQFQVFADGDYKPSFETPTTNCPGKFPGGNSVDTIDPRFICSDLLSAAAMSARIKILQNDIYYRMAVLTVDKHKNPSVAGPPIFGKPLASKDFYNIYRTDNGSMPNQVTQPGSDAGGYCAVPPSPSGRGWLALPALGVAGAAVLLAARRRRKRR